MSLYLPLIALVLTAILHNLSDDGGASLFAHFKLSFRLPEKVVPAAVLVFGIAAGITDKLQSGDYQHAIVAGLMASLGSLFGAVAMHAAVNKTPAAILPLVAFLSLQMTACKEALHTAEVIIARDAECLVNSQNLPDEEALLKCGVQELQRDVGKKLLHASRANSAKEATDAANRMRAVKCTADAGAEGGK